MGVNIGMYVKVMEKEGMEWNYVGQDRDKFWAVVIKVMKI
jgi:hypothetical protein